jgi:hypothetical protein
MGALGTVALSALPPWLLREAAQRFAEMGMPEAEEARGMGERFGCSDKA